MTPDEVRAIAREEIYAVLTELLGIAGREVAKITNALETVPLIGSTVDNLLESIFGPKREET